MIHKNFLVVLVYCFTTFVIAQNKTSEKDVRTEPITVEGCQYEEEIYECSQEKLQIATFQFLKSSDVLKVANSTTKDTIFVNVNLYTDENGNVNNELSSLKFHETEMKLIPVEPVISLKDFKIELAPISKKRNSFLRSHLFLKIDRENNTFIPLYTYVPKRVPFSGPEVTIIYPGCKKAKTNKERKRCMAEKISAFVGKNYNTRLGKRLNLDGIIKIYVVFKVNEQGKVVEIRSRAPHPKLEKEAIRVTRRLPRMQPATIENIPVSTMFTLPIVFKVNESAPTRKK